MPSRFLRSLLKYFSVISFIRSIFLRSRESEVQAGLLILPVFLFLPQFFIDPRIPQFRYLYLVVHFHYMRQFLVFIILPGFHLLIYPVSLNCSSCLLILSLLPIN